MRPQHSRHARILTTAAAAAALLLSGCGDGTGQTGSSSQATAPAATPSATEGTAQPDSSAPSQPTPDSSSPSQPDAASATARCKAAGLTASAEVAGGAAGSIYLRLDLVNSGTGPCVLAGFPGVSLTAGASGDPIGAAAARDASTPVTDVVLAPGQAGSTTLRYAQAGNYQDCTLIRAAGLRIYPPEDTASLFIADPRDACSNPDISLLTIGAFQAK